MSFQKSTILLIPDLHAKPGDKFLRLQKLRTFLRNRRPHLSKIIQIGDLWDFPSLCTHDKDLPEWNTRSFKADLASGFKALDLICDIGIDWGLTSADIVITEGNHENRYHKWMQSDNRLLSSNWSPTMAAQVEKEYPAVNYIPFQTPYHYSGISFCHYFVSGVMNRAHSGERPALSMLRTHHCSTVAGHKHTLDFAEHTRPDASKLFAFVCGSFVNPSDPFSFAGAARHLWWTGCHLLHIYRPGEYDVESISLDRMT